jgi:hypothetical protein
MATVERLLFGITLILAILLPFGLIQPVLVVPPVNLTSFRILIMITAIAWIVPIAVLAFAGNLRLTITRRLPPRSLVSAALIFLFIATLSAVLAPDHHANARSALIRLLPGFYLMLLVTYIATTPQRVAGVMWGVVAGAGASALLGLGEAMSWPELNRALLLFKTAPSLVGGVLRVSATFQYTTIASMYFEMAIPLALVLVAHTSNRYARTAALAVTVVCTAAVVLTLTRSGMGVVLVLGMLGIGLGVWRFRALLLPVATMIGTLFVVAGLLFLNEGAFRARLMTEDDTNWYNAAYIVPDALTSEAGVTTTVHVEVQNTGEVPWRNFGEHAYQLGYYWESIEANAPLDMPHTGVDLPHNVAPGESVELEVEVKPLLPPGEFHIVWGMLQRNVLWFRHRDVPEARTLIEITPPTAAVGTLPPPALSDTPPGGNVPTNGQATISRYDLWRAAFAMWLEHPLLGVGPDNFRLLYGPYLGYDVWYLSNHANNLYIELLATMGVLGFAAFLGFVGVVLYMSWGLFYRLRNHPQTLLLQLGLTGCLLAFFLHGFFDYAFPWKPTLSLFWMSVGLIASLAVHTKSATS